MGIFHKSLLDALACLNGNRINADKALAIISAHVAAEHSIDSDFAHAQRAMLSYQEHLISAAGSLQGFIKHRHAEMIQEAIRDIEQAQGQLTVLNTFLKDLRGKTSKE